MPEQAKEEQKEEENDDCQEAVQKSQQKQAKKPQKDISTYLNDYKRNIITLSYLLEEMAKQPKYIFETYFNELLKASGKDRDELKEMYTKIRRKKLSVEDFLNFYYDTKGNVKSTEVNINSVANYLLDEYDIKKVEEKREKVYIYENGIWKEKGEGLIATEVENLLDNYAKNNVVREVVEKIKRRTNIDKEKFHTVPEFKMCLENGVLDMEDENNIQFLPFDKNYFFKTKIPINYDPDADCPKFKDFLRNMVHDVDIPQIQEWFGLHLIWPYLFKKAVIIQGEKDTGKTVLLNVLTAFVGVENAAGLSLQDVANGKDFDLLSLKDALANIYDDLSTEDLKSGGGFKMAVGDGQITAEEKFGGYFRFRNTAKMTFACNQIPPIGDMRDDAYYGRWLIWCMEEKVPKEKQDRNLTNKLTTPNELSGILNWAIEGYKRLINQNHFSNEKDTEEIRVLMMENSDNMARFASECLEYWKDGTISKDEMYEKYCSFCEENNLSPFKMDRLGKKLRGYAPYIRSVRYKQRRYWANVKFKDEIKIWEDDSLDAFFYFLSRMGKKEYAYDIHCTHSKIRKLKSKLSPNKFTTDKTRSRG